MQFFILIPRLVYSFFLLSQLCAFLVLCEENHSRQVPVKNTTTAFIWSYKQTHNNPKIEYKFRFMQNESWKDELKAPGDMVAASKTSNMVNKIGWVLQSVGSSATFPDYIQAYWSGFLETNQTLLITEAHYNNTIKGICDPPSKCTNVFKWLRTNMDFMLTKSESSTEPFWYQVRLILWQIKGMIDAYDGKFIEDSSKLTSSYLTELKDQIYGIYLLSISADLADVMEAVNGIHDSTTIKLRSIRPSCSALIKVLPDNSDIYTSHDTWSGYQQMLRVLKAYNFPWGKSNSEDTDKIPGSMISFSSYPSTWTSIDDYYLINSGLSVIETTNEVYNKTLTKLVENGANSTVLEVFRVMIANRLANSGSSWVETFSNLNSGTYNNQWMVLDRKQFKKGEKLPEQGLFTVAEQMPGLIHSEDMSKVLAKQGYWSSFNLAYFPEIQRYSGQIDDMKKEGDFASHEKCPRSLIFKRDQDKVIDMHSMYSIMRYNEFDVDPLSACPCLPPYSAELSIAARCDLNSPDGRFPLSMLKYRLHGATDTKLSNMELSQQLHFIGVSSPTYEALPPFQWSRLPVKVEKPSLHPDKWMFSPVIFAPNSNDTSFSVISAAHLSRWKEILEKELFQE